MGPGGLQTHGNAHHGSSHGGIRRRADGRGVCTALRTVGVVPTCLLVRHGRTASNASGVLAGWTPGIGLDGHGRTQVEALAARLRGLPIRAVVSSPLQRCQETADVLVAERPDVSVTQDERLAECRYGAWTGRALSDLTSEPLWRVVQDQPSAARFPDGDEYPGEGMADMSARAVTAIRALDAQVEASHGADALWVAVSHGDVIKAILADAAGAHLDHFQRIVVSPASVSAIRHTSRRPFVLAVNGVDDVATLVPAPAPVDPPQDADTQDGPGGASAARDEDTSGDAAVGGGA